ncbi:metallophosphoesterase [Rubripirellula amarantea]|nr:metallophosphoesterase [Rubripirellula amarantea]
MLVNLRTILAAVIVALLCSVPDTLAHEGHGDSSDNHNHDEQPSRDRFMTTRSSPQVLPLTKQDDVFHFVIYGDRTGGVPEGLKVLEQAVKDTNLLDPDMVMTVGDLIQGYNDTPQWLPEMKEYKAIMNELVMPWYPVAGNHDVYWRGKGEAPAGQHESNYEKHFGPLWYSFAHKNAGFIVLYSDEGDPVTNEKDFSKGRLQRMSDEQLDFLKQSLQKHSAADHVFVFLHHPRWIMPNYQGGNWDTVHQMLKDAGNVSAVFAGHIHHIHYGGQRDGIEYHTLATTGGHLSADIPGAGYLHHINMVSVRKDRISVSAIPVGAVLDPKEFTPAFLEQIALARRVRPVVTSSNLAMDVDGSADGNYVFELTNPSQQAIDVQVTLEADSRWKILPDHFHAKVSPSETKRFEVRLARESGYPESFSIPRISTQMDFLGESARIRLPSGSTPVDVALKALPADYFSNSIDHCLKVGGPSSVARIESESLNLPDGPFTVEAWVRPHQSAGYLAALAKTENSEFAIFMDEGVPQFDVHLNGKYVNAKAKNKLPVNQWSHVAGVFDGSEVRIFVNGSLVAKKAGQGKRGRNKLPLFVGADTDGKGNPTRPFLGDIDEVRISKIALYTDDFTPSRRLSADEQTVVMLHFDRQIGPYVLDQSNQAIKATLGSDASLVTTAP